MITDKRILEIVVAALLIVGTTYLTVNFGIAPLVIVGAPGVFAYLLWRATYVQGTLDPSLVLPPFLLTVACFSFHAIEEKLGHYGPAVGRLFAFVWTDDAFVIIVMVLLGVLALVAAGLVHSVRVAGFVAILFAATRIAELAILIFPLIPPAVQADNPRAISATIAGVQLENAPNYYHAVVASYYFPGMYTVALPVAAAIYCLIVIWRCRPRSKAEV